LHVKVARPVVGEEEIKAVTEVLMSEYYVSGPRVKKFEESFAKYIGTEEAVGVDTGTDAIRLTLQALGIGKGDEVIVPALTFFATASAVLMAGGTPIFADIDPETYNIDIKDVHRKITGKTKAVIPVHYFGHPADLDKLPRDVIIIEDAAQAHGAEYKGKKVGGLSKAGCWSMYATKNMTVATEGGMITTNDHELAATLRTLRSHGMMGRNDHVMLNGNNRMNEIAGAIGQVQLPSLDYWNRIRAHWSSLLRYELRNVPWLKIPPVKDYCTQHAWFWCCVEVDEERLGMSTDDLRKRLMEEGVETRHRYVEPLYKQPVLYQFLDLHDYSSDFCPVAEKVAGKLIGLPNHPLLTLEEINYVKDTIYSI